MEGPCKCISLFIIVLSSPCLMTFYKQNRKELKNTSVYIDILLILIYAIHCSTFYAFWLLSLWTLALRQFNHDWFNCVNPINKSWPRSLGGIILTFLWVCLQSCFFFKKKKHTTKPSLRVFAMCIWIQRNLLLYRKSILDHLKILHS